MSRNGQVQDPVSLNTFFSNHAVFTVGDLQQFMAKHGSTNQSTRKALLTYHRSNGRIAPIRRGLYASVPPSRDPDTYSVDPFLVAAKMADDAVLAYHSALEYHGKAYSVYSRMVYTSKARSQTTHFRSHEYVRVPVPHALLTANEATFGTAHYRRDGVDLRVTNLERTFVDVLDRPEVSGSWEEIWRSLESIEFFDITQVVRYVTFLGNATTAAKVGFFLDQHRDTLMVDDDTLSSLKAQAPRQPHYLNRAFRTGCRLISEWNLLVPDEILNRSWKEVL